MSIPPKTRTKIFQKIKEDLQNHPGGGFVFPPTVDNHCIKLTGLFGPFKGR